MKIFTKSLKPNATPFSIFINAKKKPKLKKLERTHEKRGAGLARIGYDPKSLEIFGGIVE